MVLQTVNAVTTARESAKTLSMLKKIGSTTFVVNVHFNEQSKETIEDKILRLIEREAANA